MELEALIRALAPGDVIGRADVEIADLAYDTRRVVPGSLFFCVGGVSSDGHDLAADAVQTGACAVVVERAVEVVVPQLVVADVRAAMPVAADVFFGQPTRQLEVAGVTGTNGKTTTSFLLRSILAAAGRRPGLVGTVTWIVGGTSTAAPFTTPEAIDLQRLFRQMLDAGDRSAAVEASSHGAHFRRLDQTRFAALVFTNLTQDHLDLHETMEDYFQAKRRLFTGPAPPPAAVNVGDPWGRRLADELGSAGRAPLVTFGLRPEADVRAGDLELRADGSTFTASGLRLETPLPGIFNVENVLGAVAAAQLLDVDDEAIVDGVRAVGGVPGRFERIDEGQPFTVLVDYAHTPGSLDVALSAARSLTGGKVIVVLGAGGDRDRDKRAAMGEVARARADVVILTSDNPRGEDPLAIIEDLLQGTGTDVEVDPDRRAAITRSVSLAAAGDVVLVAGKGHEQGQEVAGVVHPFDDREVVRAALREAATPT